VLHHVTRDAAALGKYRRRVAIARALLDAERVVDVLRADDDHHRTEDFLLRDAHLGRDVIDERRADPEAGTFFSAAVDQHLRSRLLRLGDVALDPLLRLFRNYRTDLDTANHGHHTIDDVIRLADGHHHRRGH